MEMVDLFPFFTRESHISIHCDIQYLSTIILDTENQVVFQQTKILQIFPMHFTMKLSPKKTSHQKILRFGDIASDLPLQHNLLILIPMPTTDLSLYRHSLPAMMSYAISLGTHGNHFFFAKTHSIQPKR